MKVIEINFREWYKTEKDLANDEKRDVYPPRFITHLKCHQPSTLDVTYTLHVIKDSNIVKDHKFSIFVEASRGGNTKYSHSYQMMLL